MGDLLPQLRRFAVAWHINLPRLAVTPRLQSHPCRFGNPRCPNGASRFSASHSTQSGSQSRSGVMEFKVGAEFKYEVKQRSTVILNVHALRTPSQEILEEHFSVEPKVRCEEFLSTNGENRFVRLD